MRPLLRTAAALAILAPSGSAHERWVRHELLRPFDEALFGLGHLPTLLAWGGAALLLVLAVAFGRPARGSRPDSGAAAALAPAVLRIGLGLALLLFAIEGCFLAPDLAVADSGLGRCLVFAAAGMGVLLVCGLCTERVAATVAALYLLALLVRPFRAFEGQEVALRDVLAYLSSFGMCAYLWLRSGGPATGGGRRSPWLSRSAAVAALRLALGLNLVLLGIGKFLEPALFVAVVQNYPEVFHAPFRPLSAAEVALAASIVETLLGALLLSGALPRFLPLVLLGVFGTTTALIEGETLGHLPLIAAATTLLLEAPGRVDDLFSELRRRLLPGSRSRLLSGPCGTRVSACLAALLLVAGLPATHEQARAGGLPVRVAPTLSPHQRSAVPPGDSGAFLYRLRVDDGLSRPGGGFSILAEVADADTRMPVDQEGLSLCWTLTDAGGLERGRFLARALGEGRFVADGLPLPAGGRGRLVLELRLSGEPADSTEVTVIAGFGGFDRHGS